MHIHAWPRNKAATDEERAHVYMMPLELIVKKQNKTWQ